MLEGTAKVLNTILGPQEK